MNAHDSRIFKGEYERFQDGRCLLHYRIGGEQGTVQQRPEALADVEAAIRHIPQVLTEFGFATFDAVGHRIAHGGERFHTATLIDEEVLQHIAACTPLVPLHNPSHLAAVKLARALWPTLPHVAVFDTAFHHTIPASAYTYAISKAWRDKGVRRYGFHGTSHKYIALRAAAALGRPVTALKIISCHLGNGSSVCAINGGFSVDTSMGMTPLEGLVMGTRSGDVDPGIFNYLQRELGLSVADIEHSLYKDSGLSALAGTHDLRDIEAKAAQGDSDAQLAINVYAYRVRKYIGSYAAAMDGVDALVFTGGIGEHSASMRRRICDHLGFLGIYLDDTQNQAVQLEGTEATQIQSYDARVKVLVTQAAEQWMIAKEVQEKLQQQTYQATTTLPVAVSARHVHLSNAAVEQLFGKGYQLTKLKSLSQPEGWAAEETVEVIGPKGSLAKVRVLGPTRSRTQVEVSRTDTFMLGLEAPVRVSGQLDNTPKVTLRGPAGEIETDGLIIAARHIHMHPDDATAMGVQDGDYVDVRLGDSERGVLFTHTLIRVKASYITEMHIDTDEANAAGISLHSEGALIINHEPTPGQIIGHLALQLH